MTTHPLLRLTRQLRDARVAMDGVRERPGGGYEVIWLPSATDGDRATAAAILAAFDPTPPKGRKPRPESSIVDALKALNGKDYSTLLLRVVAAWLQEHPDGATSLGINIPGDEPDS